MSRWSPALFITALVSVAVFWVAYDNGSYALSSRASLAIAIWWAVIVGIVLQLVQATRLGPATFTVGGLLVTLTLWTFASAVLWAPSFEDAFNEFNRLSLFLGIYTLVVLVSTRSTLGHWADALALAIGATAVISLASRLFPDSFPDKDLATFLPSAATRLSFPLGYWNALAILVGLGVPLLLRIGMVARHSAVRGLALAPIPVAAAVIYLASSRGGVVTALVGTIAFIVLTDRRWTAATAIALSGAGSAAVVAVLLDRKPLVNGPLGTELVRDQGETAAILIALVCAGVAVAFGVGCRLLGGRIRPSPRVGRVVALAVALALAAAVATSDPVHRFETFRESPAELTALDSGDFVTAHLLSGSGSGRWQFWTAAASQWRQSPIVGDGAGTYEHWWAEHASFTYFLKDAHSLYLEMLGELGVVGFVLVLALVLAGVSIGVRRSLLSSGEARVTTAALTAVFVAYAAAAGFDWIWELTAVSVVGLAALALVSGPATGVYEPLHGVRSEVSRQWTPGFRVGILTGLLAWLLIVAQAVPLLADRQIARSQAAVHGRDFGEAMEAAEVARDIQPWASTPYLQLALVSEVQGEVLRARAWIEKAIERDARDWQLWLVSARLETKLGKVGEANRSLRRAAELNPRSPLFAGLLERKSSSD